MKYTIQNNFFRLSALTKGAELTGFESKKDDYEYIWQKCDVWQGQSPLLFPVVGKLKNDELKVNGEVYAMPKHGFAKGSEFALESIGSSFMTFVLKDSEETRRIYPFRFELRVTYRLTPKGFIMHYDVKNTDGKEMYFSLGAHPAFNIALGDKVVMDKNETVQAWRLGENMVIKPEKTEVFAGGSSFEVTKDVFKADALIFEGLASSGTTVKKADGRNVHVHFGNAPCVGMWAKPAASYVCIEPWYGLDDKWNAEGTFENKPHVQKLAPGKEFVFDVAVEVE